ncbi:hypothetical protein ACJMK2_019627 [Sinanodonta woodiana]|uniref:Reelin domain-containing protein n=1 Tax=Sinanodonta woodiana TaxID=1069815 RepID=A0ABD3TWH2_SINWO
MDCRKILAQYVLLGIFVEVICYPRGAPATTCSSMMPNHGVNASSTTAPYTIITSKSTYRPNEVITVTIQGASGENVIAGFLIQPRKNSSTSQSNTIGTLTGDFTTKNPCTSPVTALTHTNNTLKTTINMNWTAPAEAVESVVFVATIVRAIKTYWVNVQSQPLTPVGGGGGGGVNTGSSGPSGLSLSCSLMLVFILHKYVKQWSS